MYTPFQFFVAQQIVSQEKLRDSVAVVGYVGNNAHFLDIYEFMNLEKLWKKKYVMTDLPHWDGLTTRTLNDVRKAYSNYTKLKSIAKDNNIDSILSVIIRINLRDLQLLYSLIWVIGLLSMRRDWHTM